MKNSTSQKPTVKNEEKIIEDLNNLPKYQPKAYLDQIKEMTKIMAKDIAATDAAVPIKRFGIQYIPKERLKSTEFNRERIPKGDNVKSFNHKNQRNFDIMSNPSNIDIGLSDPSEYLNKSVNEDTTQYNTNINTIRKSSNLYNK